MKTKQLWLVLSVALATAVVTDSVTRAQAPPPATHPAAPPAASHPPPPGAVVPPPAPATAATPAANPDARRSPTARLPGDITTIQYLEAPDRRFQFKATAGVIPLYDAG